MADDTVLSRAEIKQDVLTNPRYAAFFAPYHPDAVAMFASYYAESRLSWQEEGPRAEAKQMHVSSRFSDMAYERLWDIQRKKLFDLQCRWRAGHLALPDLRTSAQFSLNGLAIERGCGLDPIAPEELEMYCDFVRQAFDFDDVLDRHGGYQGPVRDWQDYDGMRLYEDEFQRNTPSYERRGVAMPAWYDFHNMRTGNGIYLGLPDQRGPLERHYMAAYRAAAAAKMAALPAAPPPAADADLRPRGLGSDEQQALLLAFVQQFETPQMRRQREALLAQEAQKAANRQVSADFAFLAAFDPNEAIPIDAAADWRAALRRVVQETQREQLLAHLPQVYEEYQMRQALDIEHPARQVPDYPFWIVDEKKYLIRRILDGRAALGEPRNFDFYD